MTTLPLKSGGTTVTILHPTEDAWGDKTWADGDTIAGCLDFPSFSSTGRISYRAESTITGADIVTETRTLYMPFGTVVGPLDRILIHPDGQPDVPTDPEVRRHNTYDILGEPMQWKNILTGWAPACEVALIRIT